MSETGDNKIQLFDGTIMSETGDNKIHLFDGTIMSETGDNKATKSPEKNRDSPVDPDLTPSALHDVRTEEDSNSVAMAAESTVDENDSVAMEAESSTCVNGGPKTARKIKINRRSFFTINPFIDEHNDESNDNQQKLPAAKASEGLDGNDIPVSSSSRMIPTSYTKKKLVRNNEKEKSAELVSRQVRFSADNVTVNVKTVENKVEPPKKKHKPITWP